LPTWQVTSSSPFSRSKSK